MQNIGRHSHSLGKIALVFMTASLCVKPSAAQNDLQILVSGPWSYVHDQKNYPNRLLLVAPAKKPSGQPSAHQLYLLPGTNVTANPQSLNPPAPTQPVGIYTLDYDSSLKGNKIPQGAEPTLCGAPIADPGPVDTSTTNYVISLPMPDSFSTYVDPNGVYSGTSKSRISSSHITWWHHPPETDYATLMVLHYGVTSIPPTLTLKSPGHSSTIATVDSTGRYGGGVSIVAADPMIADNDWTCDHVSLESVQERNYLWAITEYARFPKEKLVANHWQQIPGKYDYSRCNDTDPTIYPPNPTEAKRTPKSAVPARPPFSGGSADCHACQMSILNNGMPGVPGAIIKP